MFLFGGSSWESKHLFTPPMRKLIITKVYCVNFLAVADVDPLPAKNNSLDNDAIYAKVLYTII